MWSTQPARHMFPRKRAAQTGEGCGPCEKAPWLLWFLSALHRQTSGPVRGRRPGPRQKPLFGGRGRELLLSEKSGIDNSQGKRCKTRRSSSFEQICSSLYSFITKYHSWAESSFMNLVRKVKINDFFFSLRLAKNFKSNQGGGGVCFYLSTHPSVFDVTDV